jgi:hypothetical protein
MPADPEERPGELQGKLCAQWREVGRLEGRAEGYAIAVRRRVLQALEQRRLVMSDMQRRIIAACMDPAVCDHWLAQAFLVSSVDELFR